MDDPDEHRPISASWPGARAPELEDLLAELRSRASLARRSRDRLSQLLDAVVAVSADLDLAEVLGRIVESAAASVDASVRRLRCYQRRRRAVGGVRDPGPV